jgi:uncharacterized protein YbaP (TraB family)
MHMRRAIASLLLALALAPVSAPTSAASSQEPTCYPESIIAELDRKDPETTARILREAAAVKNSQAMLWRIERPGLAASYLFGTIHVADRSLAQLSATALTALRSSTTVALETEQISSKLLPYVMAQAGPLMAARNKPLQHKLDEDELKVVERSVAAAGYPQELALGIRPWVAAMFLTGSNCQAAAQDRGARPLDLIIADEAKRNALRVHGLESMLEQFEALAAIDDDVQVAWLKTSIATHDRVDDIAHTLAELYRFRRLEAVWRLTRELAPSVALTDAQLAQIRDGLVAKRNPRLLARALPLIEAGGAFIAVGALHLSGDDGLVEDLRRNGYSLTAIE